jgi:hypothetical protein
MEILIEADFKNDRKIIALGPCGLDFSKDDDKEV